MREFITAFFPSILSNPLAVILIVFLYICAILLALYCFSMGDVLEGLMYLILGPPVVIIVVALLIACFMAVCVFGFLCIVAGLIITSDN